MNNGRLRIGVVGVGFGATVHIPAFQSEGLEVVAVCARRPERAQACASQFGVPNMAGTRSARLGSGAGIEVYGTEGTIVTPQRGPNPPAHGIVLAGKATD